MFSCIGGTAPTIEECSHVLLYWGIEPTIEKYSHVLRALSAKVCMSSVLDVVVDW